ncbi:uncharacterized protein LOC128213962 [Mya arenaria]|uniref:uncharacterized protein LOC128213962 n=1 Tax=Mya arenaria TaxID=6604 RepID=UPI0022E2A9D8|nr:uncharacterized protein LOC128213962 [Mya arenaria]
MESFREDSLELVKQIELSNTTADILQGRGDMLRADDALRDSCHQPFDSTFRGGFPKCVTFYEALQRAWRKMQMRGLVGAIPFPVTQEQASNITENDFVKLAKEAHGKFTETERNRQKEEHFANLYATVSKLDLNRLRIIHKDDFNLFEYDDMPSTIFG